jgi:hypothetical protein
VYYVVSYDRFNTSITYYNSDYLINIHLAHHYNSPTAQCALAPETCTLQLAYPIPTYCLSLMLDFPPITDLLSPATCISKLKSMEKEIVVCFLGCLVNSGTLSVP